MPTNKKAEERKFVSGLKFKIETVWSVLKAILSTIKFIFFVGLLIFIVQTWNFDKADKILSFIEVSFWPIITLLVIFLFKDQIANLISRGIVIILPGGHEVRLNQDAPSVQTIQQSPQKREIKDYDAIKNEYEKEIKQKGEDLNKLKAELINTQIYLDFERIYRLIFGSQLDLLKRLRLKESLGGEESTDTMFSFALTQRVFPIFNNWTLSQYSKFLFDSGLINLQGNRYLISDKGKAFLSYIEFLNYPRKDL